MTRKFNLEDVRTLEEPEYGYSEEDHFSSLQRAVNSGTAWTLQGSYGRAMMDAINAGRILLGTTRARDAYGNVIPSRTDVAPGTKGSREFVAEAYGEDWAKKMENA